MTSKMRHIWNIACPIALALALSLGLTACADSEYEEEDGPACTEDSDCAADEVCTDGTCEGASTECEGPNPSETCLSTGCADGLECLVDEDASCIPSACSCEEDGWVCTADCGQPFTCQEPGSGGCDEPDPSVTCLETGCPEGLECLPSDDGSCVPSNCSCSDGIWGCTADCGQPYACQEPGANTCPDQPPIGDDAACNPGTACDYGQECCCGECYASTSCFCTDSGEWACAATDACFIDTCEGRDCDTDSDCEGGGEALSCVEGTCQELNPTGCDTPDPSETCLDTGCADGLECLPSLLGVCVPSSCFCDEETGSWACTDDCGAHYACQEPQPASCPDVEPIGSDEACEPGTMCDYGQECCCGACSPSISCSCDESGQWGCYATEACNIFSCEGRACDSDADCVGGAERLSCVDGVCQDGEPGACEGPNPSISCQDTGCDLGEACVPSPELRCAPSSCSCDEETGEWICTEDCGQPYECAPIDLEGCDDLGRDACDETPGCRWFWAAECPSGEFPALEESACLPDIPCREDQACPDGTACSFLEVLPECAVGEDPNEPVCDACSSGIQMCLAR